MVVKLHKVEKYYQSGPENVHVLKGIDLTIEKGTWITITGPSGSGKTTLLRCFSGIEKPDDGEAVFHELDVMKASELELREYRRQNIGYIFQDFQLFDQFDVWTNVMIPLLPYEAKDVVRQKAKNALASVGLTHRQSFFPHQLSGGEKQRTAIARALMNEPNMLLCDEPTGNLDIENRNQIIGILQDIHQAGATIILVTHDAELATLGDKHYEMKDGRLREKVK
ncbi:ABC transporter ATP-binding protein [Alkalihalobacillus pseudalcaliphilus]|uniref:ABC transporter ATP-binding protein n=1 Tax=Alkalihalobacillus pseudalcaliphilus TaxID=79884 RepID=UPI00064DC6F5|nr:ABC transporter ATP-binding protein [Alkalihalobacillus pseudalcaliphilus]KMK74352.1 ABC transporter ATP-binding protein [Alkalihalobacillus pseudalcaliphilus]